MPEVAFNHYPKFFTATILEWKCLLEDDTMKEIMIDSLRFLVNDGRVIVYGFIIMRYHIHVICLPRHTCGGKYRITMRRAKCNKASAFYLIDTNHESLENYKLKASDRDYQFWERNFLSIDLWNRRSFIQKLNYIHNNPVAAQWKLCQFPEEYKYSSYRFYETGVDEFGFLSHYDR